MKGTLLAAGAALALCSWIVVASGSGPRLSYGVGDLVRSEIVTPEPLSVPDPVRTEALRAEAVAGKLRGNDLTLSIGKQEFTGRVKGNTIEGTQQPVGGGAPQQVTLTRVK